MSVFTKNPWTRQPQFSARLNQKYATDFAYNPAVHLPLATYTNTTRTYSEKGIAQNFVDGSATNSRVVAPAFGNTGKFVEANPGWLLVVLNVHTLTAGNSSVCSRENTTVGGGWDLVFRNITQLQFRQINTGANSITSTTAGDVSTGVWHVIIVNIGTIFATPNAEIYIDGINKTSSSVGGSGTNPIIPDSFIIGGIDPAWVYNCLDGEIALIATGKCKLSTSAIAELTNNPWQVFEPLQRIRYIPVVVEGSIIHSGYWMSLKRRRRL